MHLKCHAPKINSPGLEVMGLRAQGVDGIEAPDWEGSAGGSSPSLP